MNIILFILHWEVSRSASFKTARFVSRTTFRDIRVVYAARQFLSPDK